jgi:hypothetical protein
MKKILFLFIALLFSYKLINAQPPKSQRLVLIEHFTQASCVYCPAWNAAYNALVAANPGKVTILRYQVSWPGYDPMYLHNPGEVSSRVNYYGVTGVPNSRLDGTNAGQVNQGSLDARYAVPSPCTINLTHHLSVNYDSIYVTMVVTASENIPAGLKAHIAIIEEHIHFTSPPGSNGEKDFYNVMKKFIPSSSGTTMPAMTTGQTFTVTGGWKLKNVYDINELAAIGFVQDNGTKDIKNAGYSPKVAVVPLHTYDANLRKLIYEQDCSGKVKSTITFANFGSAPLTSLSIKYQVNGGTIYNFDWNSSTPLNFLEQTTVELPEADLSGTSNNLKVYLTNPNGQPDQNHSNDTSVVSFSNFRNCYTKIYLKMKLDGNAAGITWKMLKPNGSVLTQGGPYVNNQPISVTISAPEYGCFKFIMMDSDGDGLTAPGYYKLYDSVGNVFADSVRFTGYQVVHALNVRSDAGIKENLLNSDISVFPNPLQNETMITYKLQQTTTVKLSVIDLLGNTVYNDVIGIKTKGEHQYQLNVQKLKAGVYFIKMDIGDKMLTRKIVINK